MVVLTVIAIVGAAAGGLSYRRTRTRVREHHTSLDHTTLDHGTQQAPEPPVDIPPRVARNRRTERVGGQP